MLPLSVGDSKRVACPIATVDAGCHRSLCLRLCHRHSQVPLSEKIAKPLNNHVRGGLSQPPQKRFHGSSRTFRQSVHASPYPSLAFAVNFATTTSAYEGYRYEPRPGGDSRPITCPIICLGGEEDGGAPRSDLERWSSLTAAEFRLQMFRGGHFFLQGEGEQAVLTFLGDLLTEKLR